MSNPRRDRALAPSLPALTPASISDLSPELKRNALEMYIRSLLHDNNELAQARGLLKMSRHEVASLKRELELAQRDNETLRSILVPVPMPVSENPEPGKLRKERK